MEHDHVVGRDYHLRILEQEDDVSSHASSQHLINPFHYYALNQGLVHLPLLDVSCKIIIGYLELKLSFLSSMEGLV